VGREIAVTEYPEDGIRVPDIDGEQHGHRPRE
jgi:hypothetical protein